LKGQSPLQQNRIGIPDVDYKEGKIKPVIKRRVMILVKSGGRQTDCTRLFF
jgi:hypothetical protein